jgi:hypothetical protein
MSLILKGIEMSSAMALIMAGTINVASDVAHELKEMIQEKSSKVCPNLHWSTEAKERNDTKSSNEHKEYSEPHTEHKTARYNRKKRKIAKQSS